MPTNNEQPAPGEPKSARPRYNVKLLYFKPGGKYYSEGEYLSEKEHVHEIFAEVEAMFRERKRPGLVDGPWHYVTYIDPEGHPEGYPSLLIPPNMVESLQELPWFLELQRNFRAVAPEQKDVFAAAVRANHEATESREATIAEMHEKAAAYEATAAECFRTERPNDGHTAGDMGRALRIAANILAGVSGV